MKIKDTGANYTSNSPMRIDEYFGYGLDVLRLSFMKIERAAISANAYSIRIASRKALIVLESDIYLIDVLTPEEKIIMKLLLEYPDVKLNNNKSIKNLIMLLNKLTIPRS